jgi:hypothetical protein
MEYKVYETKEEEIRDFFIDYLEDYLDKNCLTQEDAYSLLYFIKHVKAGLKANTCPGEKNYKLLNNLYTAFLSAEEYLIEMRKEYWG